MTGIDEKNLRQKIVAAVKIKYNKPRKGLIKACCNAYFFNLSRFTTYKKIKKGNLHYNSTL